MFAVGHTASKAATTKPKPVKKPAPKPAPKAYGLDGEAGPLAIFRTAAPPVIRAPDPTWEQTADKTELFPVEKPDNPPALQRIAARSVIRTDTQAQSIAAQPVKKSPLTKVTTGTAKAALRSNVKAPAATPATFATHARQLQLVLVIGGAVVVAVVWYVVRRRHRKAT